MIFDWCGPSARQHTDCIKEYERFFFDAKGKLVMTGEIIKCGCKCHSKDK